MRNSLFCHTVSQGVVKHRDISELAIAAEMIGMRMGVDHQNWLVGHRTHGLAQIANATTCINQRGPFLSGAKAAASLFFPGIAGCAL
jgi:hypothetical protein